LRGYFPLIAVSKLPALDKFFDFSDYGRPFAILLANLLKNTRVTPIHVTLLFGVAGCTAVYCIVSGHYWSAGFFLILKSILDAADGELARVKNTPSYTGRYLDSVFDIVLNMMFVLAIWSVAEMPFLYALGAFVAIQLQGTLYNYYYVILRHTSVGGDTTSQVFETRSPAALPGEHQRSVDILFSLYLLFYGVFDRTIRLLDQNAYKVQTFPRWFMTCVSVYGLGFQLLIMAVMLPLRLVGYVLPFLIVYSAWMIVLITIRKFFLKVGEG